MSRRSFKEIELTIMTNLILKIYSKNLMKIRMDTYLRQKWPRLSKNASRIQQTQQDLENDLKLGTANNMVELCRF
jgi:hypothetical protein